MAGLDAKEGKVGEKGGREKARVTYLFSWIAPMVRSVTTWHTKRAYVSPLPSQTHAGIHPESFVQVTDIVHTRTRVATFLGQVVAAMMLDAGDTCGP